MKAAGATGAISGGFAGIATAQEDCADVSGPCDDCKDTGCDAIRGGCTHCLDGGCEEIPDTRLEAGTDFEDGLKCLTLSDSEIPDDADRAVIKAANDCHECKVVDTSGQTFCIDGQNAISHIEFAECPGADITVDCPNDRARIDVELADSVYFEVDYRQCDESSKSGTLTFTDDAAGGTEDDWHTFVALADCEGNITVWNSSDKNVQFDTADFDCESGTVTADCEADKITVFAEDTTDLWYEIDYDNCDVDDVDRTMVSGLDTEDEVTILEPIPNCEGTVTLYEDEGSTSELDSDTFDCVTASVSVDCSLDVLDDAQATISAPDTDKVWYEIDYDNCDVDDVGRTEVDLSGVDNDSFTFDIAECDGTISVWDAASGGEMLASATIDCADADVNVTCTVDASGDATATIDSPDMNEVWYEIDYSGCDEDDVSRTSLDFSSTDSVTFDIAECDGTITVYDGAGSDATDIASATFECADADVTVACELDTLNDATATISANDTDTVWYTTTYTNCDESGVTRKMVDLSTTDSKSVDLAECDGSIEVYDAESGGNLVASADIDCADAKVTVDCSVDTRGDATATINAPDADTVWYTTTYTNCDESGVTRKMVDLSTTDSETVDLAECDGSIEVYDAESNGDLIASADIDCADAEVSVACSVDTLDDAEATINAPDADTVWYEIDYDNCDVEDTDRIELDLSSSDEETFDIAECDGTIDVYDAASDGDLIASANIDCADADVTVACELDTLDDATATITAPDTDMVWYGVSYEDNCEADDVPRTKVELMGSTDTAEVDLAECSGTITVWDAASGGTEIASSDFNCGDANVTVDCEFGPGAPLDDATATITAPDLDTVWYTTSYVNCDDGTAVTREMVDLSGVDNDSATVDLAECDGTIEVYDAASGGDLIASATIDCADAEVTVNCVDELATITAPDTDVVEYEIVYAGDCNADDVLGAEITLGDDDEATVSVADCEGTINVYDLEGDLLATDSFDCVPTVTGLGADCELVTADFSTFTAGDQVRVDVDVKDSTGTTITSLDSGNVTLSSGGGGDNVTVNDTDNDGIFDQVVYTYSNELSGTQWQTVDVSVFLVDQNRLLDTDPTTDGIQKTTTFDVGPCGCPECVTDEKLAKLNPEVGDTDSRTVDLDGDNDTETVSFEVTAVDQEGEPDWMCFTTTGDTPAFCDLCVGIQAGRGPELDESCTIERNSDGEYCVSTADKFAISHIDIFCADVCPIDVTDTTCIQGTSGGE